MAYFKALDGDGSAIYFEATGSGTTGDPYVVSRTTVITGDLPDTTAGDLAAINAALADPATQTTAAAILAKLSADPSTETTLAAVAAALAGTLTVDGSGVTQPVSGTVTANLSATDNSVLDQVVTNTDYGGVTGGGTEAGALRVTVASDSTGVVSVDDGGGSLTVDGTVTETNSAAILADTAAMDTNLATVAGAVSGTEMQVDVVTLPALAAGTNNIGDVDIASAIPAGTNTIGKVQPFSAVLEGGVTELIGINEQVDQNDYSGSVGVALGGTYSGEILQIALYSTEDGTGAVQTPDGVLLMLDADPAVSSGDTALAASEWPTVFRKIAVGADDWTTDTAGGVATYDSPIPFHAMSTIYFVFLLTSATSFNDAAGDDEQLEFNFWYRRDS